MNTDELIEFCGGDTCENVLCSFVSDGDCCGNNCKVSYDCGDCIKKFLQRETRVNVLHSKQSTASAEARARNAQCQQTT